MVVFRAQPSEVDVQSGQLAGTGPSLLGVGLIKKLATTTATEKANTKLVFRSRRGG